MFCGGSVILCDAQTQVRGYTQCLEINSFKQEISSVKKKSWTAVFVTMAVWGGVGFYPQQAQAQSRDQVERDVVESYDRIMGTPDSEIAEEGIRAGLVRSIKTAQKNIKALITGNGGEDMMGNAITYDELGEGHEIATTKFGKITLKKAGENLEAKAENLKNFKIAEYAICQGAMLQVTEAMTGKWAFKEKVAYPREEMRCDDLKKEGFMSEKEAKSKEQLKPYLGELKKLCKGGATHFRTGPWGMNNDAHPKERTANLTCLEKSHRKGVVK